MTMTLTLNQWRAVGSLEDIPPQGARVVKNPLGDIAVFRTADDEIFALMDRCPHKGGPLSQGIVYGKKVSCPLHGWKICLEDGMAEAPDIGCAPTVESKLENGVIFLRMGS